MRKYRDLIMNTILFAIGKFASKFLLIILVPLHTSILSQQDYGFADLLNTSVTLLIPLLSLSISDSVFRFAIDEETNKLDLFTNGLKIVIFGFVVLLLFLPLINNYTSNYTWLFYLLYTTSALNLLVSQFVRGLGHIKLFTLNGVIEVASLLIFNILFLLIVKLEVSGYLLSIIGANIISILFLFFKAKLHVYVRFETKSKVLLTEMVKYSVFLIPNSIAWWATNMLGRYIIVGSFGLAVAGLYAAANKLPSIINLFSSVFYSAWQLSASQEYKEEGREAFYSNVFSVYSAFILIAGSITIAFTPLISKIVLSKEFYEGWVFVPFMMVTAIFSCYVNFFGSFYAAAKKNLMGMVTTLVGAVISITLYLIFVPTSGPISAAIIGAFSYAIVMLLRIVDIRKTISIKLNKFSLAISILLIVVQAICLTFQVWNYIIITFTIATCVFLINIKPLIEIAYKIFKSYRKV